MFAGEGAQGATQSDFALSHVAIKTPKLHLLGRDFSQADLTLRPREGGWQIALNMREAVGDLIWRSAGEGALEGRLRRLVLRPTVEVAGAPTNTLLNSLPSMTLAVDELYLGEKQLGQLDLKARNDKGAWQLDTLNIKNPDGTLRSHGVWQNKGRQQMRLDFDLAASDLGKLLDRLGYGDCNSLSVDERQVGRQCRKGAVQQIGARRWQVAWPAFTAIIDSTYHP